MGKGRIPLQPDENSFTNQHALALLGSALNRRRKNMSTLTQPNDFCHRTRGSKIICVLVEILKRNRDTEGSTN